MNPRRINRVSRATQSGQELLSYPAARRRDHNVRGNGTDITCVSRFQDKGEWDMADEPALSTRDEVTATSIHLEREE